MPRRLGRFVLKFAFQCVYFSLELLGPIAERDGTARAIFFHRWSPLILDAKDACDRHQFVVRAKIVGGRHELSSVKHDESRAVATRV